MGLWSDNNGMGFDEDGVGCFAVVIVLVCVAFRLLLLDCITIVLREALHRAPVFGTCTAGTEFALNSNGWYVFHVALYTITI